MIKIWYNCKRQSFFQSLTPKGAVIRTDISSVRRDDSFADREHCLLISAANTKWHLAADSEVGCAVYVV